MTYSGERAEYCKDGISYENATFIDGESCLKHSTNIDLSNCKFKYKYPLWNTKNVSVTDSHFFELGKSGLWYVKNISLKNCKIEAPKEFRRSSFINLENVTFTNAAETMWTCDHINLKKVNVNGDYFAMNSSNFTADGLYLDGNYFLDGGKDIEIRNSHLISKDAFWNCENVTVYDSYITGEYLGWYSKNLKFVNCTIESNQGLCYINNLQMENCKLINTDLAFEYCTNLKVDINSTIESVKNPLSGTIKAPEIGCLILNPKRCDPSLTKIDCPKIGITFTQDPNKNEN